MLQVGLFFCCILITSGRSLSKDELYRGTHQHKGLVLKDLLWVLKVQAGEEITLKLASPSEEEEFDEYNRSSIDSEKKSQVNNKAKSPRPRKVDERVVNKEDIFRLVNKFALYTKVEPDSYLTESFDDDISITLYFKNQYSSIVINVDNQQWHFFIGARSPLPSWFYEDHSMEQSSDSIAIPEGVKQRFYAALLQLLHTMLGHIYNL